MDILTKLLALLMYCAFICGILSGLPAKAQDFPFNDGDYGTCSLHYDAARQNVEQLNALVAILIGAAQPTPEAPQTPVCVECAALPTCLWKPVSDTQPVGSSQRGGVILLPRSYEGQEAFPNQSRVTKGNANNPEGVTIANGGRVHIFIEARGDQVTPPMRFDFNERPCVQVSTPDRRVEGR